MVTLNKSLRVLPHSSTPAILSKTGRVSILILSCLSSHPLKGLARVVLP
jgi:hypothetical protein